MRSLVLVVAISALAWARPETYKETEDFQYSRSSSDGGSKSGFYGAQRGNVAGNYEKAHNMDTLAQHQMSGAINQVQGELGDASKTGAGSVFTAANTRGVYGSGLYDLNNLQGRNFGEASDSHSSLSSAYNQHSNSDWRRQSQQAGYGASNHLGQSSLHTGSLQAAEGAGYGTNYDSNSHSRSSGYHSASGYHSQSGYNSQNNYDASSLSGQSGAYGTGDQSRRYTIVTPVRIVTRPGAQIAIPVYGEAGYDAQRASSSFGQSSSSLRASQTAASSFDQNAINSEAEVLNNNHQNVGSVPVTNGKHYSSSYNYQKAWERHSDTTDAPVLVAPVPNPLSANSELYEDAQSTNAYNSANRYNSYSKGSSQSNHNSDYRSQHSSQTNANSNAYTQGAYGSNSGLASLVDSQASQPKSYQSSYSYHKSWEKQGDPYVIVPATNGEASQRIVSANTKNSASSQHYGSQQRYSPGSAVDCDSLCRYRRATRSADYYQQDLGQQAQTSWDQSFSQQVQDTQQRARSENLEDLGQQTQDLGQLTQQTQQSFQQQSQSADLEDLGQQTQDLGQLTQQSQQSFQQQSQSADLEDLGQQTQNLEDFGQQTQQSWGHQRQSQPAKLEDLGQQTQDLEDFGQQSQQSWGHQRQSQPAKLEDLGQQTQDLEDFGQQTQQSWGHQHSQSGNLEDFGQRTQGKWHELNQKFESNLENLGQQTQQSWNNIEQQATRQNIDNLGQQTQGQWDNMASDSQQSQQTFENLDNLGQQTQHKQHSEDLGQQTYNTWDNLDNLGQQVQTQWDNGNKVNKTRDTDTNTEQQTQSHVGINIHEIKPNTDNPGEANQSANNPDDLAFWGLTNEPKHENNNYFSQHNYNNYNSHSNSQGDGVNWGQHLNKNNAQTTNNNPLQSIWDKLDKMEEQSEHSSNENQQDTEFQNSQHVYRQESTYHHESNRESSRNSSYNWNQQQTHYLGNQSPIVLNTTTDKPKTEQPHKKIIAEKPLPIEVTPVEPEDDDEIPAIPETAEVGRGDIGPEEDSKTTPNTVHDTQSHTIQMKPEKSPKEIEALSLSRGVDKETTDSLSVLSISQQKLLEEERQRAAEELHITGSKSSTTTSTTTPRSSYADNVQQSVTLHKDHNLDQQQFSNFDGHQRQNLDQQNLQFQNLGQHSQDTNQNNQKFDQLNTGQQSLDFGQQTQELDQQNLQQFSNLGQYSQNFDQQNTGQQSQDFGQETQDLEQQNLQPFTNLDQHSQHFDQQNTGQHLLDFAQQTQDLSQQNLQLLNNLGQQKYDQQNKQQFEDFGQQTQTLDQQNLQQFTNSEQASRNSYQNQPKERVSNSDTQVVQEQKITPVDNAGSHTHPKQEVEIVPPSVTTEKPGFWRSVGNKFTSAKDSVASWFSRS